MSFSYSYEKLEGTLVEIDPDAHYYIDSEGHGKGWKISKTIPYDGPYFKVNYVSPGADYPIHIRGRDNDLGWIKPSAIIHYKDEREEFRFDY